MPCKQICMTALAEEARSLYAQQRYAECERVCRTILAADPDDVNALSLLGYLAANGGMHGLAATCFARASEIEPDDAGHRGALASALRLLGRHEEALSAQQAAVARAPTDPAALNNLAQQYAEAGRFAEAVEYYEQAIAHAPTLGRAHYGLALIKKFAADDSRISVMLAALDSPRLDDSDRTGILFSLGRAFDDLGDFERAFGYFQRANELRKKFSRFDAQAELTYVQRLKNAFDEALLKQNHSAGDPSASPVFVVGMPRSGSTLLEQLLASHPDVRAGGELPWAMQIMDSMLPRYLPTGQALPEAVHAVTREAWAEMGAAYIDKIGALQDGAQRLIDKQLFNYMLVGPIHLMLPNARFIHCRRDPLDTCVSCYTQNFAASRGFTCDLNDLGRAYRSQEMIMNHWREWLPDNRLVECHYEDLVSKTEDTARTLVAFLGLPWSEQCLAFASRDNTVVTSSLGQVRQDIYQSSVGRWRRFEEHLSPLRDALTAGSGSA